MNRHLRSENRASGGFTLIEMLVVITIIGLLIALTVPSLTRTMEANRLTAAGEGFTNRISQAQQLAAARNKRIQIWFIHASTSDMEGEPAAFKSYVICEVPTTGQQATIIAGPFAVESGIVIADTEALSPLLAEPDIVVPDIMSPTAEARASVLELSPDGGLKKMKTGASGTGLVPDEVVLARSFLTFVNDSPANLTAALPLNFYTVQIDPYTARPRTFRPMVQ